MQQYIWGTCQTKKYSILEVSQSQNQIVIRPIGTKTHLTLHKLDVKKETDQYWIVKYQNSPLKLYKNSYAPISFSWNSSAIRGVWSDLIVDVARKSGFLNPEKHATSSQGLLVKCVNTMGYDIGTTRIELNHSSIKAKYLKQADKIAELDLKNTKFMVRIILSTPDNEYKNKSDCSFETNLGKLFIVNEEVPVIRIKRS
ncbi:MAG: hypothetical protein NTZ93_03185 [Candidatus Beckwithbacteria bacterium]|nr:hypothetical protein [Candidatus Beckwithbacteria bacterium]